MSSQTESALIGGDETDVQEHAERQKRLGQLRTDMHTLYDIPFQALDGVSTRELRKIARNRGGDYSPELQAEAKAILREREDPQDRDTVSVEL